MSFFDISNLTSLAPHLMLKEEILEKKKYTKTQCIKVKELRKIGYPNLRKWIENPDNLYVGRHGRIFITNPITKEKEIFHYPKSKWHNPYKVGKKTNQYSLADSLRLYKEYLYTSGLIKDIGELEGKTLGCFCDQKSGDCHSKVLVRLLQK